MRCEACGRELERSVRNLHLVERDVGPLDIPAAEVLECGSCSSTLYSPSTALRISQARQARLRQLLQQRPIADFVTLGDAARLLGRTKQALSKDPRVRNGFIYSVVLGKRPFYLKESVLAYGDSRDGRIPLAGGSGMAAGRRRASATGLQDVPGDSVDAMVSRSRVAARSGPASRGLVEGSRSP